PRPYGAGAIHTAAATAGGAAEIGLVVEFIAATADDAIAVASVYRQTLLHYGFPGRVATAGNLAFPFTPPEIAWGPAYRFSLYHVMTGADPAALFSTSLLET
ncbi:MAG: hypothetical protein ABIU95_08115, partial [Burkholderiales bacterium]